MQSCLEKQQINIKIIIFALTLSDFAVLFHMYYLQYCDKDSAIFRNIFGL